MATKTRRVEQPARLKISDHVPGQQGSARARKTVGDMIVDQIEAGVDAFTAAAVVGVSQSEFAGWMREGQLVHSRLNSGADWRVDFTSYQQDSYLLSERVIKATATHVARLTRIAEQAARGELKRTHKRVKSQNGQVVEEVTTTETVLPDTDMIRWKLEHHAPDVYGQRATLNVIKVDLSDTPEVAATISHRMEQIAKALLDAKAIEVTGE